MTSASHSVVDHAEHTSFSSPGRFGELFADLPATPVELSAVARNLIVHYRSSACALPAASRDDIDARWIEEILALDQARHPRPLAEPRDDVDRVQGCCRDHALFCVAALRSHGIPARSRVGYGGYFMQGWHIDHVVAEAWIDGRWQRFDPEIEAPIAGLPTPMDIAFCEPGGTGFVTAAQAWAAYRNDGLDVSQHGLGPDVPLLLGERFVFDEVIYEVAHRFGDELLLWDCWGKIGEPGEAITEADAAWLDDIAALLLSADAGDLDAEQALLDQYRSDDGLRPGAMVIQASPYGKPPIEVSLNRS